MTFSPSIAVVSLYPQLLWHRSVAETLAQDFLSRVIKWLKDPNLIMKEVGLRGISNLALHPGQVRVGDHMEIECWSLSHLIYLLGSLL